jgi:hypothetical protein
VDAEGPLARLKNLLFNKETLLTVAQWITVSCVSLAFTLFSCFSVFVNILVWNTVKVLRCGAGERWRRSVHPIMWQVKKYYTRVKEERSILHTIKWREAKCAKCVGNILHRNCPLKQVIEGTIEGMGRWGKRQKQLLDDRMEKRRYWNLKEEAVDHTLWWACFGRAYGPVARQAT